MFASRARAATLAAAVLLPACGSAVEIVATHSGAGAGGAGGTTTTTTVAPPPIDAGDFCSGGAAIELGGAQVQLWALTSSQLVMNCCEGAVLRFHTHAPDGPGLAVSVKAFGASLEEGTHLVDGSEGPLQANAQLIDDPSVSGTATGTVTVTNGPSSGDPTFIGVCLRVSAPGTAIDGARLYAPMIPVAQWAWQNRFGLWLLADSTITATAAAKLPLESLPLASQPVVNLMNIAWYEGATHTVRWDTWSSTGQLQAQLPQVGVSGVPFVVQVDDQRIYLGAFWSLMSSMMFDGPTVMMESMNDKGFTIEAPPVGADPRSDPQVIKVLGESAKLVP